VGQPSSLVESMHFRIKHCMHHSQPISGGDDCAKPSVFKMISSILFALQPSC
jgi:hypothetical protein